jgi:hypothetical protein
MEDAGPEIAQMIHVRVLAGVDGADAIVAAVRGRFGPGDIAEDSLQAWVTDALADEAAAEADWPDETDCDRLDVTLASLLRHGIMARQNAGRDADEALADVAAAYVTAGGDDSGIVGFCFYDYQDLLRAADGDDLLLSFGEPHGDPDGGVHVGRQVRDTLEAAGFTVVWDGTLAERIAVTDLVWQRRRS